MNHTPWQELGGCSSPLLALSSQVDEFHFVCDMWPVRRQTCDWLSQYSTVVAHYVLIATHFTICELVLQQYHDTLILIVRPLVLSVVLGLRKVSKINWLHRLLFKGHHHPRPNLCTRHTSLSIQNQGANCQNDYFIIMEMSHHSTSIMHPYTVLLT